MNENQATAILVRTFGYILHENEGIMTDDIDGTKYFVYKHEGQIKISIASDSQIFDSTDYKLGKWIWFHKTKEECIDAAIDDYISRKEIEDMTKSKEIT